MATLTAGMGRGFTTGSRLVNAARLTAGVVAGVGTGGLYLAAQEGLIQTAGAIYEGHAERMRSSALVNAAAPGTAKFTQEQARSSNMGGMAKSMGMEFEEFASLTSMLGQAGSFKGVSNLQEFKTRLRQSLNQLKEIASVTNSTLQEAGQIGMALKQQGFNNGQLPSAAAQAFGIGQATGLGAAQVVQMGAIGAQYGAQTNMGQALGSSMFQESLGSMEFAMQRGAFSNEMVQRMGGTSSSATLQLMQGTMGQAGMLGTTVSQMMGYITKKGEGEYSAPTVDKAKLEKLLNGGVSRQELAAVSQTQQVLGMSSPIQREAMPMIGQALHATLSQGTSSQEEYLRKAEMMGIQPDVALALRETERSRGLMTASARLEARQNELEFSASQSADTGFRMHSFGISRALGGFGESISRGTSEFVEAIIPSEKKATQATSMSRDLMRQVIQERGAGAVRVDQQLLTNAPRRGEGSGNPFFKGEAESRREAMAREFAPLMTTMDQSGSVFGETTMGTFRGSRSQINEAVRHRNEATRDVSEKAKADASFLADSGAFDDMQALRGQELGMYGPQMFNSGFKRDMSNTLAMASKMGLITRREATQLASAVNAGMHNADQGMRIQQLKNKIHATGQAIGHDFSGIIGSDISGASGAGAMSATEIQAKGDEVARNISRRFAKSTSAVFDSTPTGLLARAHAGGIPQTNITDTPEAAAIRGLFSAESRESTLKMIRDVRREMAADGGTDFNQARMRVESAAGLTGAELTAFKKIMTDESFSGDIENIEDLVAAKAYQQIASPVAERALTSARRHFQGQGGFGGQLIDILATGGRDASHDTRSREMQRLLFRSVAMGEAGLSDEIKALQGKEGLEGVTNIFNTIEQLYKGTVTAEQIGGGTTAEQVAAAKGDYGTAIRLAKDKGLLDVGIVGDAAQAQARAGDRGRASLGSDLASFSRTVESLASTVRQLQVNAGIISEDGTILEGANAGINPENESSTAGT